MWTSKAGYDKNGCLNDMSYETPGQSWTLPLRR